MTALPDELGLELDDVLDGVRRELVRRVTSASGASNGDLMAVLVLSLDERLGRLESTLDEFRPLLEMVRDRAARGSWKTRFGGS